LRTLVNIPGRPNLDIAVFEGKVPTAETVTVLSPVLLKTVVWLGEQLWEMTEMWGIGGDCGEIIKGVHRRTEHVEIFTTKKGCEEICEVLSQYVRKAPSEVESRSERDADVDGKMLPVYTKSWYAELVYDKTKVEVHGDERIRVGEWDWGDPLEFEPDYSYILTNRIPIVPLRLKQELDLGLGWLDRLDAIAVAIASGQHHLATGGVRPK
jgi:hypothetical protein